MAWTLGMRAAGIAGGIALASVVWPIAGQQDVTVAPVAVVASAPVGVAHVGGMRFADDARLDESHIDRSGRGFAPMTLHCAHGFVVVTTTYADGTTLDDITCASEAQTDDAQNGA